MIGAEEMREIEPNCIGTSALHSPRTAITSYEAVARKMASEICSWGGSLRLETEVGKILERRDGAYIQGHDGILDDAPYDHVIACSGLQSDRLARASGDADEPRIVPFFGLYYVIDPAYKNHVKGLIYPVPDPRFPFLGVHFTKRIDGEMTIGPNAFISLGRENYSGRRLDIGDVADFMSFLGFWKFAAGNTAATLRELKTVISRKSFVAEAARYVPSLSAVTAVPAIRGIRAQAMQKNGRLVDDFVIRKQRYVTHIRNAPSPGATSSMAIAEYIVREVVAWQDK
jgi:L-2-hydroxyglutarate oxidase LhgO